MYSLTGKIREQISTSVNELRATIEPPESMVDPPVARRTMRQYSKRHGATSAS